MATTTVADLIADVRYDLKDFAKQKFDDTYLVKMLNRGIRVLDRELITIGSNLNIKSTSGTLASGANYLALSKTVDTIHRLYISQDELIKKPLDWLYRYRIDTIGSDTGQPYYFAIWGMPSSSGGRKLEFDYTADQDYTIYYIYNYRTGDLVLTDYIPYDDMFNDYLRTGIIVLCQKASEDKVQSIDFIWKDMFKQHAYQLDLSVSRIPKYNKLDF